MFPLYLFDASFTQRQEPLPAVSPDSLPPLFFCVPGEALQHGPFQQPPPNNKNIVLFYFVSPPLHLSGAITVLHMTRGR